jgi:nickel-dependent lactate racemase
LEPHLLLGFGGGLKMIIPGCAAAETIGTNHMQGVDPDHFNYVGVHADNSPMRLDLEEGAQLLGREIFIVNAAVNEQARPTRFFCGDPIKAHRAGEAFVANLVRLEVPEQSDVVLTNSYPMDLDLRQSVKCMGNTLYACKPGGVLMGCAKCERGLGEMTLAKKTLPYPLMRGLLRVIGKRRVLALVEKAKRGEPVEEKFVGHFGLQMLRRNHLALFSDSKELPPDIGRKMGLATSFTRVQDMIAWASKRVPRSAAVWVFPFGGSTYAVPVPLAQ